MRNDLIRWFEPLATLVLIAALVCTRAAAADYPATLVRVVDGDTLIVSVEVWPDVMVRATLRVAKINTPESRGAGISACELELGARAKDFTTAFVRAGRITVAVKQHDKYGRVLADVLVDDKDLGSALLAADLARPYAGERRGPWCDEKGAP